MKTIAIIIVIICAILVIPGARERIVSFANQVGNRTFSTLQHRTTISSETRQEEIIRQSRLQPSTPTPKPNPYRAVSDELKAKQPVTMQSRGSY